MSTVSSELEDVIGRVNSIGRDVGDIRGLIDELHEAHRETIAAWDRDRSQLRELRESAGLLASAVRRYFGDNESKAVVNMQPLVERIESLLRDDA